MSCSFCGWDFHDIQEQGKNLHSLIHKLWCFLAGLYIWLPPGLTCLVMAAHPEAWWVRAVWFCSASSLHMLILIKWTPNPVVNLIKPFALPFSICYMSHSLSSKWDKLCFFLDFFLSFCLMFFRNRPGVKNYNLAEVGLTEDFQYLELLSLMLHFSYQQILQFWWLLMQYTVELCSWFTDFPVRTVITVSPGCKRPLGYTVMVSSTWISSSVSQPFCRAQILSGGWIIIVLQWAFLILLICLAMLRSYWPNHLNTSKPTWLENRPQGLYSGNSKRVQTNLPQGAYLFIVVFLLGKYDKVLLWRNETYLKCVNGMASSKSGFLSAA